MSKTYRVYALDVSSILAPVTHVLYVQSAKYDGAWKGARGALDADKRGKPVNGYPAERATLFSDEKLATPFAHFGDALTVARIDDMTARNVKIDAKALRDALSGSGSDADKLAAAAKMLGIALPVAVAAGGDAPHPDDDAGAIDQIEREIAADDATSRVKKS